MKMFQRAAGVAFAVALIACPTSASAEYVQEAVVGDWVLASEIDTMTDQKKCLAVYQPDKRLSIFGKTILLGADTARTITGYRLRFDEEPVLPLVTQSYSFIALMDGNYERAISATRLRVRFHTYTSAEPDLDANMTGAAAVVAKMKELGCQS